MKKHLLYIALIIILSVFGFLVVQEKDAIIQLLSDENISIQEDSTEQINTKGTKIKELEAMFKEQKTQNTVYSFIAGGDIMLDRGVEAVIKRNNEDYSFPFALIKDDLKKADFVFANLEGSMSDIGTDTNKKYSFRFEPDAVNGLLNAGINLVSLANNHMLDWGRDSLCETTKILESKHIDFVGAGCNTQQAEDPYLVTLGNTHIAVLAYTEFYKGAHATQTRPGMTQYDLVVINERIVELKKSPNVDVVMVSMHWGDEYKPRANSYQVSTAQGFIDSGADVVIGHHPHVVQEIERYKDGWIIYSLGNFVFDQSWSKETMQGLLADIKIQNKKIIDVQGINIQLNNKFQPFVIE